MNVSKLLPLALLITASTVVGAQTRTLQVEDIMAFETLQKPVISDNGNVIAVEAKPDRGESRSIVSVTNAKQSYSLDGASSPITAGDGRFVIATIKPSLFDSETKEKSELFDAAIVLDTQTGKQRRFEQVKSVSLSDNGQYLAVWHKAEKEDTEKSESKPETQSEANKAEQADTVKIEEADKGTKLTLVALASDQRLTFEHVTQFSFNQGSQKFAVASNNAKAKQHQVKVVALNSFKPRDIYQSTTQHIGDVSISADASKLAFTFGKQASERWGREYQLGLYDFNQQAFVDVPTSDEWVLNQYSQLTFSLDNERLFVGRVRNVAPQAKVAEFAQAEDVLNTDIITAQRDLRVWHGDDAKIKPHEVKEYQKSLEHTYLAVLHIEANRIVQLADEQVPDVVMGEQKRYLIASSDAPYQKMITWAGFYRDVYLVDLNTGNKVLVLAQHSSYARPTLSPNSRFMAFYNMGDVYIYDVANARKVNLTQNIPTPFANEDHDYPSHAPGYGFGPWLADDSAFVAYDKYDAWQFNTISQSGFMLTNGEGRKTETQFRLTALADNNPLPATLTDGQALLFKGFSYQTKADGFYLGQEGVAGVNNVVDPDAKLTVLARAKNSEQFVFSKQRYDVYPDLYVADFQQPQQATKVTSLAQQLKPFAWGQAELVHWRDGDGKPADGVLIKPTNYVEGQQYPVLVYFYRFMSDRLHAFPDMKINHRPNFAWYADNGYAIFLPDIRFEIGYPGMSAVKALTAGVQKIIDMGVANPDAIGIQGHSWGGYQTAFAVTQTHIFKAAVSGAPVSNMTSAYSGIRHGSGLARQFQYETGQSRIGESLFKSPQKYIENSPVFYAERIQTPMMIMFGDKDDAVPWEQGVEMYLAMRRAGKDVVFLQYQDEPHHLKKYPNKLDYSIRMMEYFDHYLKGKPAPLWLQKGEAYQEFK